jgi:hypothetical protein
MGVVLATVYVLCSTCSTSTPARRRPPPPAAPRPGELPPQATRTIITGLASPRIEFGCSRVAAPTRELTARSTGHSKLCYYAPVQQ